MSRVRDLADVAFHHLVDVLESEGLSDLEVISFFEGIVDLSEQEIAETEDALQDDEDADDEDEDEG